MEMEMDMEMEMEMLRWLTEEESNDKPSAWPGVRLSFLAYLVSDAHLCWLYICMRTEVFSTSRTNFRMLWHAEDFRTRIFGLS